MTHSERRMQYKQLTEFERGHMISMHEDGHSFCEIAASQGVKL